MSKLVRFLVWVGIGAGVTIGAGRALAIRWWQLPTNDPYLEASVAPTLRGGDWVLLWRLSAPKFGDLVLCPEPKAPGREVIGRIAGIEGDRVELEGGQLKANGRRMPADHPCPDERFSAQDPESRRLTEQRCLMEVLGSREHARGEVVTEIRALERKSFQVPAGHVLLISDNRQFPYDSRDFGYVERGGCREAVFFRLVGKEGFSHLPTRLTWIR